MELHPYSEIFSEISTLVDICYRHQSKEEAKAICVAHGSQWCRAINMHTDEQGSINPNPEELHDPSQCELAKKINEVIKASSLQDIGLTMGLSHRMTWITTDKLTAGSSVSTMGSAGANMTGNVANAQAAAQKAAQSVSQSPLPIW
jgi:hypothetical protein